MKNKPNGGKKWARSLIVGAGALAVLAALLIALSIFGVDYLVDIWWFGSLGHGFYYWQRLLYSYTVFGAVSVLFFVIFFFNFWIAARSLKNAPSREETSGESSRLLEKFQTGSAWFFAPLSLVLSIPIALPLYRQWERFLFYIFGSSMGVADPFLGKDVSFYLFSFPIYSLMQRRLLLALVLLGAGLLVLYVVKNRLLKQHALSFGRGAKWHLSLLILAIFFVEIWDFMLQRYALVYDTSHQALFFGPGYVQMKVVLPLIWACMATLGAAALSLIVLIQLRKGYKTFAAMLLLFAMAMGLRYTDFLPQMVQTYVVKPNEIGKESPYIAKHIEATLNAYKLNDLIIRDFELGRLSTGSPAPQVQNLLRNIPVWDAETLADVFEQLQELRTYYTFPLVSVGRYTVEESYQQVFLSPREIEFNNLPGGAQNWINEHMTYTHGFGAVMTPASQPSSDTMTWYLHNIPPESQHGLTIGQPRIYYGLGKYEYSIAPNRAGEMDYPKGGSNVTSDYEGKGGVPISSLLRKFLLAYYFDNKNIFFSTKITDRSKLLFRRNVLDRIHHIAPYLLLDRTPYVTVTPTGIFWIIDAYTTSSWYPAAAPYAPGSSDLNYIRNSVKIVVDAYHGSVDFYVYDDSDPIIRAYSRIYPSLFKSKAQMPLELQPHVRYPKDLFDIQMQIYANYHQTDPRVFYQQEDLWTFAETLSNDTSAPLRPYYVTLDLMEPGRLDFLLLMPMFPKGRDNLRSMAAAGCDPDNYGKIIVYNFPKGELVYGPAQIDALINQDPDIAQQFTLWDQAGSQVVRGKMIILPVGNSILFIQPVYLKATSRVKIPELQRIILSEGQVVVMEKSIQGAYTELQRRERERMQGARKDLQSEPQHPTTAPVVPGQEQAHGDPAQPREHSQSVPPDGALPQPAHNSPQEAHSITPSKP